MKYSLPHYVTRRTLDFVAIAQEFHGLWVGAVCCERKEGAGGQRPLLSLNK